MTLEFPPLPNGGKSYFEWDSLAWWEWLGTFKRKPSVRAIVRRLDEYDIFVCYHAARPTDLQRYYRRGLEIADFESLNQQAREIFLSGRFPEVTNEILEQAIAKASSTHDRLLFVVIDAREISGHYLIYGSEHICGIAASMKTPSDIDCRQMLKHFGVPTLFRLGLPRQMIPDQQIKELANHVLEVYWECRRHPRPPRIDWSLFLTEPIPAALMIDHVYPECIPDPLQRYLRYTYRDNFPCFY